MSSDDRHAPQTNHSRWLFDQDLSLLAGIDRTERVTRAYRVEAGRFIEYPVDWNIPPWESVGNGGHSVAAKIDWLRPIVRRGAAMYGAFYGEEIAGIVVVDPAFEPGLAWLAFLHVSRPYRGLGIGTKLWERAISVARDAGATDMYVSSIPSGPTVDFYLARGCRLATPPHPALFALEPDDIHLIAPISSG